VILVLDAAMDTGRAHPDSVDHWHGIDDDKFHSEQLGHIRQAVVHSVVGGLLGASATAWEAWHGLYAVRRVAQVDRRIRTR